MFIEHRFEVKHPVAVKASQRSILIVVFHVLRYHLFGVKFPLTQIALEECDSMDFLVLGEVAGIAERFVAESALV